jgi:LysR family glycine cleavage system transcriptional activator
VAWPDWLAAAAVTGVDGSRGVHFAQSDHAIQAALDGGGVLLGRVAIAAFDVAAGRLVRPFKLTLPSRFSYFFVTRPGRQREHAVAALREWLHAEARSTPGMPE